MLRRSPLELLLDFLEVVGREPGIGFTKAQRKNSMPGEGAIKFRNKLVQKNLITITTVDRKLQCDLTGKGWDVLNRWKILKELVKD